MIFICSIYTDPEEMEEMDEGEDVERDGSSPDIPSSAPASSSDQSEFISLSSVIELDAEDSKGSGSYEGESHDPWARVCDLPPTLGEKLMELKTER